MLFDRSAGARADYRLQKDSPAVGKGILLAANLEDPLRPQGAARPDIGALPSGSEAPRLGRNGRVSFPITGKGLVP